ncbi:helix-turn-helix domain-containing protein [Clostridium sporogenes]|nr:helix-turn-helix domain-containing protein [Clostridium sporogenes]NFP92016.1 helix-turn-helix domain-containing protein [Clostridium sporogenes]
MNENNKYLVIKMLIETDGNKQRAAIILNCTVRHINRMIKKYNEKGKEYFLHGNRGRKPAHTLDDNTRKMIVDLYLTKCFDANITHYSKLLKSQENINVSPSTIRTACSS